MPRSEELPDRAVLTAEIQNLAARLKRRGFQFDAMSHTAQAMIQDGRVDDLETAALEGVRDELTRFYRTIMARETQAAGRIKNLRHSVWAAAIIALLSGGAVQKFFDPAGKLASAAQTFSTWFHTNPPPETPVAEKFPPPAQKPPPPAAKPAEEKPKGPDFLNAHDIKLHGLALLVQNNDQFDRYIFNAMTGVRNFAQTYGIQGGYPFEFEDGRTYTMPYHAVLFKPCDERSNVRLPSRLGKTETGATIADIINKTTSYRADYGGEEEIKAIVTTSFELSFGVKIDPAHIQIVPGSHNRIAAIKYIGPNPKQLVGETSIATATEPDAENPERRNITDRKTQRWYLVDEEGNLIFPPTINAEQGIAIPLVSLPKIGLVRYTKTFSSQGREVSVPIAIPIDSVLEEQDRLEKKREQKTIQVNGVNSTEEISDLSWYVADNDPAIITIAHHITDPFETAAEKMQAILDFVHTFNYVPDAYGEAPRTVRTSLISLGGDCEDSSILALNLARAIGLECVFLYLPGHASLACDVGGAGSAFTWGSRRYEWAETTGGVTTRDESGRIVEDRAWRVGERPPQNRTIRWIQKVGGPLQVFRR